MNTTSALNYYRMRKRFCFIFNLIVILNMDTYTIIEDVFGDEDGGGRNQLTAARGFVGQSHVPDDMRPPGRGGRVGKVSERPDFPDLDPRMNRGGPRPQMPMRMQNDTNMSPMVNALVSSGPTMYPGVDALACRDVFTHVENCPLCKSYFRHDAKFYWLIIGILIVIILLITRNGK
ncbi:MAG: hypothetical protein PHG66_04805 [Candidatus Colwellbacteria bacterium]|nr:hypothetical protein [Candidatus Colwellbacteria bacterium]